MSALIREIEWSPFIPERLLRRTPAAVESLSRGTVGDRLRTVHQLAVDNLLSPTLAVRIVETDQDPWVRLRAGLGLLDRPRRRYRAAYHRLFKD